MSHQNKPKKRDMEKTSINEQGGDVNHMTGIPLFTVRLFKRRIRDCPNIEIGKIKSDKQIRTLRFVIENGDVLVSDLEMFADTKINCTFALAILGVAQPG